jgi:hypothetical protein
MMRSIRPAARSNSWAEIAASIASDSIPCGLHTKGPPRTDSSCSGLSEALLCDMLYGLGKQGVENNYHLG